MRIPEQVENLTLQLKLAQRKIAMLVETLHQSMGRCRYKCSMESYCGHCEPAVDALRLVEWHP